MARPGRGASGPFAASRLSARNLAGATVIN
jgi:hypothetical protein